MKHDELGRKPWFGLDVTTDQLESIWESFYYKMFVE